MKITKEDLERIEEHAPVELLRQGIKSPSTRVSYEGTLKRLVLKIFEPGLLEGDTYEQRISSLVEYTRQNPKWTVSLLLKLSEILRKRTELSTENPEYLHPSIV